MFKKILSFISLKIISKINWSGLKGLFHGGKYYDLTAGEREVIRFLLKSNYYIILSWRGTHLTSYLIALGTYIKTGKWGRYSHAFLNVEGDTEEFKLIEATGKGVHFSEFDEVFDCDRICLLSIKGLTPEDWTLIVDKALAQLGKPYDTMFDLLDESKQSCVETDLVALKALPDYEKHIPNLLTSIKKFNILTPQMIRDATDFDVALEIPSR